MPKTDPPIRVEQPRKGMIADAARKRTFGQVTDRKLGTNLARESFLRVNDKGEIKPWRVMNRKMRQAGRGTTNDLNARLAAQAEMPGGRVSDEDVRRMTGAIKLPTNKLLKAAQRNALKDLTPQDQEKILRQPPAPAPPSDQLRAERSKSKMLKVGSPQYNDEMQMRELQKQRTARLKASGKGPK